MKIIALDSSGLMASVAIFEDDTLIAEYNVQYKKTHSQTLLPMLDELKKMTELDLSSVDAIALAKGPGSFTGLRIGSATAKGLAYTLDIPIIEIPTLDGMALNLYGSDKVICPMMDARRNQVYTGLYEFVDPKETEDQKPVDQGEADAKNALRRKKKLHVLLESCAVPIKEILEECNKLQREVIFLGDGVPVFAERIADTIKVPYDFAPVHMNRQRAAAFGILAADYYKEGKVVSAADHAPEYLRLSQAEREKKERSEHE